MSEFGIADVKTYLGLQRSDNLDPVYVGIWSAFAECQPESPGLKLAWGRVLGGLFFEKYRKGCIRTFANLLARI